MTMFEVRVEKTIAAAHRLFDYNGPCESLHGHNYRVEVAYIGTELDRFGMLVDFTDIKKAFNAVLETLDHTYLNDLPAFQNLSPSAENIAAYIYRALKETPFDRANLGHVSVGKRRRKLPPLDTQTTRTKLQLQSAEQTGIRTGGDVIHKQAA